MSGREVSKKLAMWKQQYLSKGRRFTLIKVILSSLLIYFIVSQFIYSLSIYFISLFVVLGR